VVVCQVLAVPYTWFNFFTMFMGHCKTVRGDMKAIEENSIWILFVAFFILYGLEFVFPLVPKRSKHFISNVSAAAVLTLINLSFTSLTFFVHHITTKYNLGIFHWFAVPTPLMVICSIIFLDLWAGYFVHYLFHRYGWLWKLHSVHHSDDLVDVTTAFRQHPVESVIRVSFHLSGMVIIGAPLWVLLIYLTISTLYAQFEHANIQLPVKIDKLLQYIIVTPNMHKVHHSKYQRETDSNYSNILSIWDRLFGTFNKRTNYSNIEYGLDYLEDNKHYSYLDLIKLPFENVHGNVAADHQPADKSVKNTPNPKVPDQALRGLNSL
jgi:sterol desaturase/sphingolipid hydroxylase (fatty acid hydroxylase superfamily)